MIRIASDVLAAVIAPLGAELQSITDGQGREYMTNADPAFWSGRAPLLFPIIGRLQDDRLRIDDTVYTMEKHGFARKALFTLVEQAPQAARFRLEDDATTQAQYPFAFRLEAEYRLDGWTLHQTISVHNTGAVALPFSFGFHPAFAWPLPGGGARADHEIVFEADEPATLRRVTPEGTIDPAPKPSPVQGNRFRLHDALFADDALVWTDLASRGLRYGAAHSTQLDIAFPDTPALGIWTKPGAAFVCVEPWAGHADPEGYTGDFRDKPGVMTLAPGDARRFRMDVTVRI